MHGWWKHRKKGKVGKCGESAGREGRTESDWLTDVKRFKNNPNVPHEPQWNLNFHTLILLTVPPARSQMAMWNKPSAFEKHSTHHVGTVSTLAALRLPTQSHFNNLHAWGNNSFFSQVSVQTRLSHQRQQCWTLAHRRTSSRQSANTRSSARGSRAWARKGNLQRRDI